MKWFQSIYLNIHITREYIFYMILFHAYGRHFLPVKLGRVRLWNSGIRIYHGIYSGIYSGYSASRSRIAGMDIQVFRNENSSQTNAYSHYSNYSYSGFIPSEHPLNKLCIQLPQKCNLDRWMISTSISINGVRLAHHLSILLSFFRNCAW